MMERFNLVIDSGPHLRFEGECLAEVSSRHSRNSRAVFNKNNQIKRWTELFLYKTKSGKFVCHKIGMSEALNEEPFFSGKVCENITEVKEFFGFNWLSKALYDAANIDYCIDI